VTAATTSVLEAVFPNPTAIVARRWQSDSRSRELGAAGFGDLGHRGGVDGRNGCGYGAARPPAEIVARSRRARAHSWMPRPGRSPPASRDMPLGRPFDADAAALFPPSTRMRLHVAVRRSEFYSRPRPPDARPRPLRRPPNASAPRPTAGWVMTARRPPCVSWLAGGTTAAGRIQKKTRSGALDVSRRRNH